MSTKSEKAVETFMCGYNCAQSVFLSFCEDYGIDRNTAAKMVTSLGGGISKTKNICGTLSAMALAIGAEQGKTDPSQPERQDKTYKLVREAIEKFKAEFGATDCPTLLGYDISDPDGFAKACEADAFHTICPKYVEMAVKLAEEGIAK